MKLYVQVNDEEFKEWVKRTEHSFVDMIETMKDVAEVIRENTLPLTPFQYGTLGRSFKTHILTDNARTKTIMIQMSAINQKDGYNYAWIQHENTSYSHPAKNAPDSYHDIAIHNSLSRYRTGVDLDSNNPTHHYLEKGIEESMEGVFEIIEDDYLSLFNGGFIV